MTTIWRTVTKAGASWLAGQTGITAGASFDEVSHLTVFAGLLGMAPTFNNVSKS